MRETILINQVDLPVQDDDVQLASIMKPEKGAIICGYLRVITISDSYLKIHIEESGKKFRIVFLINNNIAALSVMYTSIAGNDYQITAKRGHSIGIECVK